MVEAKIYYIFRQHLAHCICIFTQLIYCATATPRVCAGLWTKRLMVLKVSLWSGVEIARITR